VKDDAGMSADLAAGRLSIVHANFSDIGLVAEETGLTSVNAIFADLGYSSDQIEEGARGLSFSKDGPLDMRLGEASNEDGTTAFEIVNRWSKKPWRDGYGSYDMICDDCGGQSACADRSFFLERKSPLHDRTDD
jgi:16S rRNA C1402 N4-methylase RsmH